MWVCCRSKGVFLFDLPISPRRAGRLAATAWGEPCEVRPNIWAETMTRG
jgi:hypothetical protein